MSCEGPWPVDPRHVKIAFKVNAQLRAICYTSWARETYKSGIDGLWRRWRIIGSINTSQKTKCGVPATPRAERGHKTAVKWKMLTNFSFSISSIARTWLSISCQCAKYDISEAMMKAKKPSIGTYIHQCQPSVLWAPMCCRIHESRATSPKIPIVHPTFLS